MNSGWDIFFYLILPLVLVIIAALYVSSRRRKRSTSAPAPEISYLRGLDFLIHDQRDLAIKELTEATLKNTDDVAAYISLGNLHREQGNIDRAIRIHESVSIRPNLDTSYRVRALFSLGQDYVRGGLLDRASSAFHKAIKEDPNHAPSYGSLVRIHEEMRDWKAAYECQIELDKITKSKSSRLLAYLLTELARAEAMNAKRPKEAIALLQKAKQTDPTCISVPMYLGDVYMSQGELKKAEQAWEEAIDAFPHLAFLLFDRLRQVYLKQDTVRNIKGIYERVLAKNPDDINTRLSLGDYYFDTGQLDRAKQEYEKILEISSGSPVAYQKLSQLYLKEGKHEEALHVLQRMSALPELQSSFYYCGKCGFKDTQVHWRCPQCREWDTFVQEIEKRRALRRPKNEGTDGKGEAT
ncbi:MAG: tetratricopeptide repeat protein [Candidatus Coatesbacteria bacterium]|nr:tetratricopeptide repeat protein [Candidatus Coatesbacteria bacterium]